MAVPGFSVSDLIQALSHAKTVYDAFFNEYTSSASQLRDLRDDLEQFRHNLKEQKKILDAHGIEYPGVESVQRTVNAYNRFLERYKSVLDNQRRKSVVGTFKTAKFVFDTDEVSSLRGQISRHQTNLQHFILNLVLGNTLRRPDAPTPLYVSPVIMPVLPANNVAISPPTTPTSTLPSPVIPHTGFSATTPRRSASSTSAERPLPPVLEDPQPVFVPSPQLLPRDNSPVLQPTSSRSSPARLNPARNSQSTLNIPGLVLPQPALSYRVAEVYFDKKKVDLKRKAVGNDTENGREMLIIDENGNLRYRHRIKLPRNQPCFPYTWHRKFKTEGYVIDFKDTPLESHSISFKGAAPISAVPKYIFAKQKDYEDCQSELRGKKLEVTFEVRKISSAASSKLGEATDQHLKIWQDFITRECSISFYASAISKPQHKEFPLSMFQQALGFDKRVKEQLNLSFLSTPETKRARTYSRAFSRSPTEASTATNTTLPRVFSFATEAPSEASSATSISISRTTTGFTQYEGAELSKEPSLKSLAKEMKYLRIEFSDERESVRFKEAYEKLYHEDVSRPQEDFLDWRMNIDRESTESIASSSPTGTGTPFNMSPVIHPIRTRSGTGG
ncbi:hypothetical protein OIDMADRAFT_177451 [Oidiodendron maius Zn]|uniref:Uncharacterized protein n=1 Tax=Oidiodendron maius (strain Zn) TaxID=913774 RepID=A0A0C3HQ67_OIDMZ|nr:hypothetical protein OIDMADRAFT_177451 [Oidiodendron maius Zn]